MIKQHSSGIVLAFFIIMAGILFNPFSADAEEFH